MATYTLGEIFDQTKKYVKNADKISFLRKHASPALFYLLWVAFSPKVEWLLPEGTPPFKPHQGRRGSAPSDLRRELRRLYLFLKGSGEHLSQLKREKMFQEMLESLSESEVDVIVSIKDKTFAKKYRITDKLLNEAFPGLLDAPFTNKFAR